MGPTPDAAAMRKQHARSTNIIIMNNVHYRSTKIEIASEPRAWLARCGLRARLGAPDTQHHHQRIGTVTRLLLRSRALPHAVRIHVTRTIGQLYSSMRPDRTLP